MKKIIMGLLVSWLCVINVIALNNNKPLMKYNYSRVRGYKLWGIGSPYLVQLTNNSSEVMVLDPSIIENEILTYDEACSKGRALSNISTGLVITGQAIIGALTVTMLKRMSAQIFCMAVNVYAVGLLYNLLSKSYSRAEKDWQQTMLREHELITIHPGETVKKIFWIKNSGRFHIKYTGVKATP